MRFDCEGLSLRILLPLLACALATTPVRATTRKIDMDDLAHRLVADMAKSDAKSAAVADFLDPGGEKSDLGIYLTEKLSDAIQETSPKSFRFLERADMPASKVTADDIASPELLRHVGFIWGVAVIVTGVVEVADRQYIVKADLRRVADGVVLATESQTVPHSRILDLLSPSGIDPEAAHPKFAGASGVTVPVCEYCPIPGYPKMPRVEKASTTLQVTVSSKGQAIKISVLKDPGYECVGPAIEGVSDWKFKPALNKDGSPAVVTVPVDLTFNTSRT